MVLKRSLTVSHAHFLKQWYLLAANTQSTPPHMHMHATIAIYSLHKATYINLLLLQEFYPCSIFTCSRLFSLHEATYTYTSHVLVSANLQVATPTNPSRYLFVYCEYTLLGTCTALLTQFLSVFHSLPIRITSRSDLDCFPVTGSSGSAVVTQFNAVGRKKTTANKL